MKECAKEEEGDKPPKPGVKSFRPLGVTNKSVKYNKERLQQLLKNLRIKTRGKLQEDKQRSF